MGNFLLPAANDSASLIHLPFQSFTPPPTHSLPESSPSHGICSQPQRRTAEMHVLGFAGRQRFVSSLAPCKVQLRTQSIPLPRQPHLQQTGEPLKWSLPGAHLTRTAAWKVSSSLLTLAEELQRSECRISAGSHGIHKVLQKYV